MGLAWAWFNDQDFKAKIQYWENREGIIGGKRWRKTVGLLDVNFDGKVYAVDEENCKCQDPRDLVASPPNKEAKTHTYKDALASTGVSFDVLWVKQSSPIEIDWIVDGVSYLKQEVQLNPAFMCE